MCAMNGFIQAHGFGRRPVKEAIGEGGNGRFNGEPRKAVLAGIRGKELRTRSVGWAGMAVNIWIYNLSISI